MKAPMTVRASGPSQVHPLISQGMLYRWVRRHRQELIGVRTIEAARFLKSRRFFKNSPHPKCRLVSGL